MGCGCVGQNKERGQLDNIRHLAEVFAKAEGVTVALYQKADGTWSFIDIECPELESITPSEFISAHK